MQLETESRTKKSFSFISESFIDPGDTETRHRRRLQSSGGKRYTDSVVSVFFEEHSKLAG